MFRFVISQTENMVLGRQRGYYSSRINFNLSLSVIVIVLGLIACTLSEQGVVPPLTQTANAQSASLLWDNPVPLPRFINRIERWGSSIDVRLCVQLNIFVIWEVGDYDPDTISSIDRTLRVEVDGSVLDKDKLIYAAFGIGITRRDDKDNVVGSHGGNTSVCYYVDDFQDGIHQESISFQSTSGKPYAYEWAFKKSSQGGQTLIDLPASLQ